MTNPLRKNQGAAAPTFAEGCAAPAIKEVLHMSYSRRTPDSPSRIRPIVDPKKPPLTPPEPALGADSRMGGEPGPPKPQAAGSIPAGRAKHCSTSPCAPTSSSVAADLS